MAKQGLYANIHAKRERIAAGSKEKKTANDPNSRINKSLRKWKC